MSLWQKREWSEMLKNSWQADEIFEIDGIFVEKRKISLGKYGLFVIGLEKSISPETAQKLENLCKQENALFFQIETIFYNEKIEFLVPNSSTRKDETKNKNLSFQNIEFGTEEEEKENTIYDSEMNSQWQKVWIFQESVISTENSVISTEVEKSFPHNFKWKNWQPWYYKKFIPPFTAVIDLEKNLEEILADMKPKGRYNIKLAEKKWVICKIAEKSKENISLFFSMMQETCSRDNFAWNTFEYYEYFLKNIGWAELFIAYFEETPIASGIFIFKDDVSFYYYGASTSNFRNLMAPYLLQWTAIQEAKKRGGKIYDFLGIASPWEKNSPLAGVTEFKTKLSQDTRKVSESFIFIEKKVSYLLIMILRKMKK
jgi:hypothetical protein